MNKITQHLLLSLLTLSVSQLFANTDSLTYSAGNILLGGNTSDNECTGSLIFGITPGSTIDSIHVYYDLTASGSGYMSDAQSQIRCLEGSNEAGYTSQASFRITRVARY